MRFWRESSERLCHSASDITLMTEPSGCLLIFWYLLERRRQAFSKLCEHHCLDDAILEFTNDFFGLFFLTHPRGGEHDDSIVDMLAHRVFRGVFIHLLGERHSLFQNCDYTHAFFFIAKFGERGCNF